MVSSYKEIPLSAPLKGIQMVYCGLPRIGRGEADRREDEAYQKGRREVEAVCQRQIRDNLGEVERLRGKVFAKMEEEFEKTIEEIGRAIPLFVGELVRRVLGATEIDRPTVIKIVEEALGETTSNEQRLEVSLSAEDFELVQGHESDLRQQYPRIELSSDSSLESGDSLVRSRFGLVDARIETKLENISRDLEAGN